MRKYRLYIDESGDHGYGDLGGVGGRYLAITGLIVEAESYRTSFHPQLEAFKQEVLPHDPDRPIVLHRRDIIDRSGAFKALQSPVVHQKFNSSLIEFLRSQQYVIVAIVLDKKSHIDRYGAAAFHPYHYCLSPMMERYCGLLRFWRNAKGDVLAESRGGAEDKQLKLAFTNILQDGTHWRGSGFFRDVLTTHELKTAKKEANVAGLQIADVIAYPSKQDVLAEFGRIEPPTGEFRDRLRHAMRQHYNKQAYLGRIKGYGMVLL